MSEKIIITCDSTADLGGKLAERYNIPIVPLSVTLGDKTFKDGVDINPEELYSYVERTGELPKTTATNIGEYIDFFKKYTDEGYTVVHFAFCSKMSSTYTNACLAAEEVENVYVVDTKNLSSGSGLLVLAGCDMLKEGLSAKEIADKCTELVPFVDASFVIDNLDYLHKGGRCSALSVLGANLLKLKPCIMVKDGVMGVEKKYRGKFNDIAKEYIKERLKNIDDIDKSRIFLTHAGYDEDFMNELCEYIKSLDIFDEVFLIRAGCTISSHCGRECLGVLFIRKSPVA